MTSAVVLAGGRSSRMGRPKALLPFDGEPLIVRVVATLQTIVANIVVVAAPEQDLPAMPVTLVHDEIAHQGPVGGIYYGLEAAAGDVSFVTSCDSAFLDPTLISHLVSRVPEYDVVVPHWDGRLQPLHAVYRKTVLPHLEGQLARGELRPVYLFDKVRTLRIDEDEIRHFDPEGWSFFNMNTPEDYDRALARWQARRRAAAVESAAPSAERRAPAVGSAVSTSDRRAPAAAVPCTVELFGVARLLARTSEVALELRAGATFSDVFEALAGKLPVLVGRVITDDRRRLVEGYACNVNGLEFVRAVTAVVRPGDNIAILSADAGG